MAYVTIRYAFYLIVLGLVFFFLTGAHAHTALIPTLFGLILLVLGLLARTNDSKRRMMVMHIAVTVGLFGFLFPVGRVLIGWVKARGVVMGMADREELLMGLICLVFVLLCVRSFIAARKARLA
jgi:hypothetical protein